jgi:hypothetical protein
LAANVAAGDGVALAAGAGVGVEAGADAGGLALAAGGALVDAAGLLLAVTAVSAKPGAGRSEAVMLPASSTPRIATF